MQRWQNSPGCGGPAATKLADNGSDPDIVDALVTGNAALFGTPQADITHAGWLPSGFFGLLAPGGPVEHPRCHLHADLRGRRRQSD